MRAYKFLSSGGVGLFSGFAWPQPVDDAPGAWVVASGPLELGANGLHACTASQLPYWINDELWTLELDDELLEEERVVVARRARLLHRVETWAYEAAVAFGEVCAWRARDRACAILRERGLEQAAAELEACDDLGELVLVGEAVAGAAPDRSGLVAGYAADVADYTGRAAAEEGSSAAWAGCAAYVSAIAAGEEASAAERGWQSAWLVERLGLA